jgi:hypothetical protein
MIPPEKGADHQDWTEEDAVEMVGGACGGPVDCVDAGEDAGATIKRLVEERHYDAILVCTAREHHARWLHHDLPHKVKHTGVDVLVIPPEPDHMGKPIEGFPDEWTPHAVGGPGAY